MSQREWRGERETMNLSMLDSLGLKGRHRGWNKLTKFEMENWPDKTETEGRCSQISERNWERNADGLQSNPCLSVCSYYILEQSEKLNNTGLPPLTPFHPFGSEQLIWSEPCCPERGNAQNTVQTQTTLTTFRTDLTSHLLMRAYKGVSRPLAQGLQCYNVAFTPWFSFQANNKIHQQKSERTLPLLRNGWRCKQESTNSTRFTMLV